MIYYYIIQIIIYSILYIIIYIYIAIAITHRAITNTTYLLSCDKI